MKKNNALPELPDKKYFTISETASLCGLKPHVLRYWEQEFTELKPSKRRGSRRYYQIKDVLLIRKIRNLLYDQGFTIIGAKQRLKSTPSLTKNEEIETSSTLEAEETSQETAHCAILRNPDPADTDHATSPVSASENTDWLNKAHEIKAVIMTTIEQLDTLLNELEYQQ